MKETTESLQAAVQMALDIDPRTLLPRTEELRINGHIVVQREKVEHSAFDIILAYNHRGPEYWVTAKVGTDDPRPTSWYWGSYHRSLNDAFANFNFRKDSERA